jgi:predicted neuraminidase
MPLFTRRNLFDSLLARAVLALGLCLLVMVWDLAQRGPPPPLARAIWRLASADFSGPVKVLSQGHIPMPPDTPAAHASSLVAMPATDANTVLAFWFAGTKESAPDVGIAMSGFDRATQQWRVARFVIDRSTLGRQLGFAVRRLGNPVAWLDAQGRVHVFVVATGLGGWAAGRVVQLRQAQVGQALDAMKFDAVRVLPLSWWWNTSHLVRNAPMPLQDGGMLLPAYFELGLKYPVALRFDAVGAFLGLVRMSARTHVLQPTLVAQTATRWLSFMRDQRPEGRVTVAQTTDAGQHWQDLPDLNLVNPDASVAALVPAPGQMWLVHNSSSHSRNVLDLSHSTDGEHWRTVLSVAQGSGADEYSYPAMAWADDSLWVSYTDQRRRIAWQRLAWPRH